MKTTTPTMKTKHAPHDSSTTTTFHGFHYDQHEGTPLYFLTLRTQHPKNPLEFGIAKETDQGTILTTHLSPQHIADIITTTFHHHVQNGTATYVALQLVQINQRYTEKFRNRNTLDSQTYYTLIFRQDPAITDAIDMSLVLEQLRTIAWTNWLHLTAAEIADRTQNNCVTSSIKPRHPDRLQKPKPSPSPWTPFMDLYLPACNNLANTAYGILTGFPMPVQYFNNRRFLVYLNKRLYDLLKPFLPMIMQDYLTYPNLIGLRSGKFTTSAPTHHTNTVTYVAAPHSDRFTSLLDAQHKYFQHNKCQHFDMFGIHFRITPLPNSTPKGLEIRNKLHEAYDILFDTFTAYRKVPIPMQYFTTDITDTVITQIIKTTHVKAFIPYFQDETNPDPDHYVLFLTNHTQFLYTTANNLYDVLPDFPVGLITPPANTPENSTNHPTPSTDATSTTTYDQHYDDDLAFLTLLTTQTDTQEQARTQNTDSTDSITTTDTPMLNATEPSTIPNQISTSKRPHNPSGETITPELCRSKHTQDNDSMVIDDPTNTNHTDALPPESIPDADYMFDQNHSQDTRLEIMDALGIAKTHSLQHYQQTYNYVAHSKQIDITYMKQLATNLLDAHNDSKASPNKHHE
jgi:hypothetical protein